MHEWWGGAPCTPLPLESAPIGIPSCNSVDTVHYTHADNKIFDKHCEDVGATPTDYEVPMEMEQHENVYELLDVYDKSNAISEEIYETMSSPDIYSVPCTADQVND